jgi:hypothetical protein
MTYSASDFAVGKTGPQFPWLEGRLTAHGHPSTHILDSLKSRVQRFQWKQGWKGTDADGFVGPETLRRLTADPVVVTPPPTADDIDLTPWKITLPVGKPTEYFPAKFFAPYFYPRDRAIVFRAPVDGATTSNSGYPRSELREMIAGKLAAWSSRSGTHTLAGSCAVTQLPDGKRELVFAQIHDAKDDVVMLLVSGDRVYVSESLGKGKGSKRHLLFSGYRLGSRIDHTITATADGIRVVVNGYAVTIARVCDGAYFKAGCYSQANESNGSGYAEVVYFALRVSHKA